MARRVTSKNELIECPYCGEKYAVTYKHCPFCNEDGTGRWDDPAPEEEYVYEDEERTDARGGKRLVGGGAAGEAPRRAGSSAPFSPSLSLWPPAVLSSLWSALWWAGKSLPPHPRPLPR